MFEVNVNKIASQQRTHAPPQHFLYIRETKSERCGEDGEEEGEHIHLLTNATARGIGKNVMKQQQGRRRTSSCLGF